MGLCCGGAKTTARPVAIPNQGIKIETKIESKKEA